LKSELSKNAPTHISLFILLVLVHPGQGLN